jgi:hypothetical protein
LENLCNFPKEDHEKKQLEEIAHLFFSKPATPQKVHEDPEKRERPFEAFYRPPQALFVYCTTCEQEQGLSTWFLFNLAVMLRLLNGPVLLIASVQAYEKRFLFGFRPDRERVRLRAIPPVPSSSFGPMGVCLLDGRLLSGEGATVGQGAYGGASTPGGGFAFRYVLSDEVRSGALFGSLPGIAVLLVTPATTTDGLLGRDRETKEEFLRRRGHVGIVVAGAGCAEEANALHRYWQGKVKERCGDEMIVEDFGAFPAEGVPRNRKFFFRENDSLSPCCLSKGTELCGVDVLDSPHSLKTKFCQTTAALIRRKRSEMVSRLGR